MRVERAERRRAPTSAGGVVIGRDQGAPDRPRPSRDDVEHRVVRVERHVLHQPRDAHARLSRHTTPRSGGSSPLRICSSVDLPVPLRPMSATRSPGSICSDTSSSSGRWPIGVGDVVEGQQGHRSA